MALNEKELNEVSGGYGPWQQYAKGSYVNYGQYIVYTVVGGDVLSGIAIRFGVTVQQICQWKPSCAKQEVPNPPPKAGGSVFTEQQKLTIYAAILRWTIISIPPRRQAGDFFMPRRTEIRLDG